MFQEDVEERLSMLDPKLVHSADMLLHLKEGTKDGKADLTLKLSNPCILFADLEHKKLRYFRNRKCADYIMYENVKGQWKLHVFELKRIVNRKE